MTLPVRETGRWMGEKRGREGSEPGERRDHISHCWGPEHVGTFKLLGTAGNGVCRRKQLLNKAHPLMHPKIYVIVQRVLLPWKLDILNLLV